MKFKGKIAVWFWAIFIIVNAAMLYELFDALSFPTGPVYMEKRLVDVVLRRGFNELTVPKWKAFLDIKKYFDEKTGMDIYKLLQI